MSSKSGLGVDEFLLGVFTGSIKLEIKLFAFAHRTFNGRITVIGIPVQKGVT